jgi:hypothetical protein
LSAHAAVLKIAVRIHIDEHRYESQNPTTGAALYQLGIGNMNDEITDFQKASECQICAACEFLGGGRDAHSQELKRSRSLVGYRHRVAR